MFINKQRQINIYSDSISSALLKKAENKKLSGKTIDKLVKIANSKIYLTKEEAENVFIKNQTIKKSHSSVLLTAEFKKVIPQISNHKLRDRIEGFLRNCDPETLNSTNTTNTTNTMNQSGCMSAEAFVKAYADRIGPGIGEGAEAIVVEDKHNNHKVFKIFYDDIEKSEIINQTSAFNRFYGENSARIISGRAIYMDKIEGVPLSLVESFPAGAMNKFTAMIVEMGTKKCAPSDLSENNFLYDRKNNKFLPVDISTGRDNKVNKDGLKYISNYIAARTVDKR